MAKHKGKGRRRMGRYIHGDVNETLGLGTLAGRTLVSDIFDNVVNERTLVSSIECIYSMTNFTAASDSGPIVVGIAHSDYTDAEIQAVLDATLSWNEGDLVAQEVVNRKVRKIGIFETPPNASTAVRLNDGRKIKTKLNWTLLQGQSLRVWAFNLGGTALATTAPAIFCEGKANLWPR